MKIPVWILSAMLVAAISVEAWTLLEVINLKVAVATLGERINTQQLAKK